MVKICEIWYNLQCVILYFTLICMCAGWWAVRACVRDYAKTGVPFHHRLNGISAKIFHCFSCNSCATVTIVAANGSRPVICKHLENTQLIIHMCWQTKYKLKTLTQTQKRSEKAERERERNCRHKLIINAHHKRPWYVCVQHLSTQNNHDSMYFIV